MYFYITTTTSFLTDSVQRAKVNTTVPSAIIIIPSSKQGSCSCYWDVSGCRC